ncbi:hypothetical protein JXA63_04720 [Candidatus Woesebacteria bacterium]|nr:hypothetical protein [Candidatus Woesebacteria bacterium]
MDRISEINEKIDSINKGGKAVIFVVTGNNSSGKTTITLRLLKDIKFYQSINLGLASKIIRYFRNDLIVDDLENFDGDSASNLFKNMVDFIINSYQETGVNIVIDGVQIDTDGLHNNKRVIGGVILTVKPEKAMERGDNSKTHFKRKLSKKGLKNVNYYPNEKFQLIDNNNSIEDTYCAILNHLDRLLDIELKYE